MSAEQYDWLRPSAQRSHRTDDDADLMIDAVERAEVDVEHKPLDDLLRQRQNGGASRSAAGHGYLLRLPLDA